MGNNNHIGLVQKKRMFLLLKVCTVLFCLLLTRTAWIQFVDGKELQQKAVEQQTKDKVINSKRGIIYDRNKKVLAQSASVDTVTVTPREVKEAENADEIADELSEILDMDRDEIYEIVTKNSSYEIIKRKIESEQSAKIRELDLAGIYLTEDSKRYYPYGNFASHVIGFVGVDNQGLNGIEMVYDKYLKGVPGRVVTAKNAVGTDMPFQYEKYINAENGLNVVLTIDEVIQHFAEKHLEEAIDKYNVPNGAACIVMDAKTGEVLAMATKPDFDLNNPFEVTDKDALLEIESLTGDERTEKLAEARNKMWRNKAVVDTYEPGSTYKSFVACMALEENVVSLDDMFNCTGSVRVGGHTISCHNSAGHGAETFVKGVHNSCNPVFMAVGARVGKQNFMRYHKLFGFTEPTGFDLPGEADGVFFTEDRFNEVELATSSFGQGFTVTPLQLIAATTAITNDGEMLKPRLVKELVDDNGVVVESYDKQVTRRVISAETAQTVRQILEGVVSEGTAKNAYIKGYRVAGKTGTSEKLPRGTDGRIASFLGFAPANDPEVICLVVLDTTSTNPLYMGGAIAAPTFQKIMDDTLRYLGVDPQYTEDEMQDKLVTVPSVEGMSVAEAQTAFDGGQLHYQVVGDGETVLSQMPKAGTMVSDTSTVMLYTTEGSSNETVVPDVVGKSVVEANQILTNARLNLKLPDNTATPSEGESFVDSQSPAAGETVPTGTVVTVEVLSTDVH